MPSPTFNPVRLSAACETFTVQSATDQRIRSVISTSKLSRTGLVIDQSGWSFDEYLKNPIVLFNHDADSPAVGKCVGLQVDGDRLIADTEFAPTDFGRELFSLYSGGFMRAWSVGVEPKVSELIRDQAGDITGIKFLKSNLIEYSPTPIPANPDAVNLALGRGLITQNTAELLSKLAPPQPAVPAPSEPRITLAEPDDAFVEAVERFKVNRLRLSAAAIDEQLTTEKRGK